MIEKSSKRLVAIRDLHCLTKLLKPVIDSKYYAEKIRSNITEEISRLNNLVNDDSKIDQTFREIGKLEERLSKILTTTIVPNKETPFSRSVIDPIHSIKQLDRFKEDENWKNKVRAMINGYFERVPIESGDSSSSSIEKFYVRLKSLGQKLKQNSQETFQKINEFIQMRSGQISFSKDELNQCIQIYYSQIKGKICVEEDCWTICLGFLKQINSEVK